MSFQTRNTFVHLRNTNEDIFDEIQEHTYHIQGNEMWQETQ